MGGAAIGRLALLGLTLAFIEAACAPDTSQRIGGETRWINVAEGPEAATALKNLSVPICTGVANALKVRLTHLSRGGIVGARRRR